MFARRLGRLPLRRCIHTRLTQPVSGTPFRRLALTLGASAAAATYLTWRLTSDNNRIALDSPQAGKVSTPKTAPPAGTSSRSIEASSSGPAPTGTTEVTTPHQPESATIAPDGGKKEADSEPDGTNGGAFNPETGEINWDCPCLGGMAHGPCGLEFREAFSCFVYSEAEPKGMDCVEKFKAMQDCFRAHPDVYADEIADDEEDGPPATNEGPTAEDEKDKPLAIQAQTEIPMSDAPESPTSTASS